jgi:hypothetical protein
VLWRIFGPRWWKWREAGEDCKIRIFIICKRLPIIIIIIIIIIVVVIKSRGTCFAGHVARVGGMMNA